MHQIGLAASADIPKAVFTRPRPATDIQPKFFNVRGTLCQCASDAVRFSAKHPKTARASFEVDVISLGSKGGIGSAPHWEDIVMRLSSTLAIASSLIALSICGLGGTASSQAATASGTATTLPTIHVEAPKQVAGPHTPQHRTVAGSTVSRRTSATNQTSSASPMSVSEKLAKIEKIAGSCVDGCVTSVRYGNAPWHGCSWSAGTFSPTCRNALNFKTYNECRETGLLLGYSARDEYGYCSSLALK
jgi:hypothetical protein